MSEDHNQALRDFLKQLDDSDVNVSLWEAEFIESTLVRDTFTEKQKEVVMRLMEKYGKRIGYL